MNKVILNKEVKKIKTKITNIEGYVVKPRNKVKYPGIKVQKMIIVEPNFIESVIKRKTTKKIEKYLDYSLAVITDDDTDEDEILQVILDLNRYKNIIKRKYSKYIDKAYLEKLLDKINLLDRGLKEKLELLKRNKIREVFEEKQFEERVR
jgi:hypothetical protein